MSGCGGTRWVTESRSNAIKFLKPCTFSVELEGVSPVHCSSGFLRIICLSPLNPEFERDHKSTSQRNLCQVVSELLNFCVAVLRTLITTFVTTLTRSQYFVCDWLLSPILLQFTFLPHIFHCNILPIHISNQLHQLLIILLLQSHHRFIQNTDRFMLLQINLELLRQLLTQIRRRNMPRMAHRRNIRIHVPNHPHGLIPQIPPQQIRRLQIFVLILVFRQQLLLCRLFLRGNVGIDQSASFEVDVRGVDGHFFGNEVIASVSCRDVVDFAGVHSAHLTFGEVAGEDYSDLVFVSELLMLMMGGGEGGGANCGASSGA
mmetsp:Transcript_29602/g.54346  ORF Transcript_29602/g.54346 Transcript_29602/m.54346 type:complete len:317 (-) Transcript_29602:118-1068(-)